MAEKRFPHTTEVGHLLPLQLAPVTDRMAHDVSLGSGLSWGTPVPMEFFFLSFMSSERDSCAAVWVEGPLLLQIPHHWGQRQRKTYASFSLSSQIVLTSLIFHTLFYLLFRFQFFFPTAGTVDLQRRWAHQHMQRKTFHKLLPQLLFMVSGYWLPSDLQPSPPGPLHP